MFFESEKTSFGFRVARYALALEDCSGAFERNTLSCDCAYWKHTEHSGLLWEEFLQTDEIIRLYDGFVDVWKKRTDTYEFTDQAKHIRMKLTRLSEDSYELQVTAFGRNHGNDIHDTFVLREEIYKALDALYYWKATFPVVD